MSSKGEEDSPYGGVECGCNSASCPGPYEGDTHPDRHPEHLTKGGAKGRSDLDNGSLASHRTSAADAKSGGQRLDQSDHRSDDAFLVVHRVHDFRHAVSLGFRREVLHEERHTYGTKDRYQDDEWTPWT